MQHALDPHRGDRRALERRKEYAAQRVAERQAETALERLGDERRLAARIARGLLLELVGLLHFLPVLSVDGHDLPYGSSGAAAPGYLKSSTPRPKYHLGRSVIRGGA